MQTLKYTVCLIIGIILFGGLILPPVVYSMFSVIPYFLLAIVFVYAPLFADVSVEYYNYRDIKRIKRFGK